MANRGRPSRPPTDAERDKIKALVELNAPIADIAKAVERSVPNLKKYFAALLIFPKKNKPGSNFNPTQAQREKVILYIGCKMSPADVARVIGCTEDELKIHFENEVSTGRAKYRAKVLDKLDVQMDAGTVGATNRLEALTVILDPESKEPGADRIGPNVGKKAAGAAAASAAAKSGGTFAPPAPPRLVVDNRGQK